MVKDKLNKAVELGIITQDQSVKLLSLLTADAAPSTQNEDNSRLSKALYYFGAMIVISAMGWFTNSAWEAFGGSGLFGISVSYAILFIGAAFYFRLKSRTLSGLLVVMAVGMTPLGAFGFQKWLNIWPQGYPGGYQNFHVFIRGGWFALEFATLTTGLISLRFAKIPFAMAPVAFTLWYMSMDLTPVLYGPDNDWATRKIVSMLFGLGMLIIAFIIDQRTKIDWAKWLYIFGTIAFWGSLSALHSNSELSKFGYCFINILMMLTGVLLKRNVFLIFGSLGTFGYIGHLAWDIFKNSLLFPFALSAFGLVVIWAGWLYHKKNKEIETFIYKITPPFIVRRLPPHRSKQ
jgi:hypothetical protein